jgi:hypothetical protein
MDLNFRQNVVPKVLARTLLLGRVKMAQAIHLRESEWAKALSEVEADPLFQELIHAQIGSERVVQYKKLGRNKLSGQFYEEQDLNVIGGGGESPETLLNRKKHLLKMIQEIGQEKFEKYFLYREESVDLPQIAERCAMPVEKAKELQDFVMEMSVNAEFYHPSALQAHNLVKPTLIGKVIRNDDGTYSMSYNFPHLARGLYDINTAALKKWQKTKGLDREQASKLRKYIGLLELSNLRQGAFWRVVEYLLRIQKEYFDTQDSTKLAPVSLRYVARNLDAECRFNFFREGRVG